ncbi:MAG: DUF192 domain-containing protein [Spirochaetales bacterium]|nr:DUF192 domain-containing protein [Spirochaetales bacterium]
MKNKIIIIAIFFIFFSITAGCTGRQEERLEEISIEINGHGFLVEVADNSEERQRGYMEREGIGHDEGMLFVFRGDQRLSFWMKNTPSPLSIAYIDSRGVIREIHHMEPFSEKPVPSAGSVRYALEVNQGRFSELGIVPGDKLEFPGGKLPTTSE